MTATNLEPEKNESSRQLTTASLEVIFWIVAWVVAGAYVMWRYR